MVKAGLVLKVSEKVDATKKDTEKFLNAILETITEELANGETIKLTGFGNFEVKERSEREGVNPSTREKIIIPAMKVPAFKFSKNVKDQVNA